MNQQSSLVALKVTHSIIWAFFAGCVIAIPVFTYFGQFKLVVFFIVCVCVEISILVFNQWRCPLSFVAARLTEQRNDNFDIYLPLWLARRNKQIFGTLFVLGVVYAFIRWQGWVA